MGIDLSGGQVAVAQQHLHDPQVRPVVQQVRCERVPQRVRRQRLGDAGLLGHPAQHLPESLAAHRAALTGHKQIFGLRAPLQQQRPGFPQVALQPIGRALTERHQPLLHALPDQAQDSGLHIDLALFEGNQFADPEPAGVEQFQHGAIPQSLGGAHIRRVQQGLGFLFVQHGGQMPGRFRGDDLRAGIVATQGMPLCIAVEQPDRRQDACHTAGPRAFLEPGGQIHLDILATGGAQVVSLSLQPAGKP